MATTETNNFVVILAEFIWEEADAIRGLTPERRTLSADAKKSGSPEWR